MASFETQPSGTHTGPAGEDAPAAPRGFYSPWFHCYKSLGFYSRLLTAVQRYARTVDRAGRHFRQLVWRELYQFSGRAPASDVAFDISTAGAHSLLEPFVAGLLRLPTVNLVALELVYQSFHQAQRRYPDVFANMFAPVTECGGAEDTPADPDEAVTEGPGSHQQGQQQEQEHSQKQAPQHREGATGEQQLQQQQAGERRRQVGYDTIWGSTIASALLQLNLLHAWIPTLERLSPFHKKALWDVCRLVPLFAEAYPSAEQGAAGEDGKGEADKEGSSSSGKQERETLPFRALITEWVHNPLQHTAHVTVLFGAVAYLSYFKVIKHEFFYPGSRVPVFARRVDDAETAENGRIAGAADGLVGTATSAPPTKKRRKGGAQSDCTAQQQPQQREQQQGVLVGTGATEGEKENKDEERLTPDEFRSMLAKVGIAIPAIAEQPVSQDKEQEEPRATTTELVERLSALTNRGEKQPNAESNSGGGENECSAGGGKTAPDAERTKALLGFLDTVSCQEGHHSSTGTQGEEIISADEPAAAEHFAGLKRELDALKDQHRCTSTAAVDESILDLPSPTQPVATAVANSLDTVHAQLPPYLGLYTDGAPFR